MAPGGIPSLLALEVKSTDRTPKIDLEIRELIRRISRENPRLPSQDGIAAGQANSRLLEEETDVEAIKRSAFRRKTEFFAMDSGREGARFRFVIENSSSAWIDGGLLFPGARSPTANGAGNREQRRSEAPPSAETSFRHRGFLV